MTDNVLDLVKFKKRYKFRSGSCKHGNGDHIGPFEIDDSIDKVVCTECDESITPMYFIEMMYRNYSLIRNKLKELKEYEKIVDAKSRVKCNKCKTFTKIK